MNINYFKIVNIIHKWFCVLRHFTCTLTSWYTPEWCSGTIYDSVINYCRDSRHWTSVKLVEYNLIRPKHHVYINRKWSFWQTQMRNPVSLPILTVSWTSGMAAFEEVIGRFDILYLSSNSSVILLVIAINRSQLT